MAPSTLTMFFKLGLLLLLCCFLVGCDKKARNTHENSATLVFRYSRIPGAAEAMHNLIVRFEEKNPGIRIRELPVDDPPDQQHDGYTAAMEQRRTDFDVISLDPTWVPEFARAGWLRDISRLLPEQEKDKFFPGCIESVSYLGKYFAVPWLIDAGVLYYRKDLLRKYRRDVPETWEELVASAHYIAHREPGIFGFIWEGKEGKTLVTSTLEFLRSNGGMVLNGREVSIDSPENRQALEFMRELIDCYRITPHIVALSDAAMNRRLFTSGRVLFLRDWSNAKTLLKTESPHLRGKIGMAPLPAFHRESTISTLTGNYLGINRYTRHPLAAEQFVRFLSSQPAQKYLCLALAANPSRKTLYHDRDLKEKQPSTVGLVAIFAQARPEPVTPHFAALNRILQQEFSAVLNGTKTPEGALRSAQENMVLSLATD